MVKSYNIYFIVFFLPGVYILAQPDSRFRPFDWVQYSGPGRITSISEGYSQVYLGTEKGGVYRLSLFDNNFSEPITMAQGLNDNSITAVYFDHFTGILWVATPNQIQYSYTREGNWKNINLVEIGFSKFDRVQRIGSSKNYIWVAGNSIYLKLDHSSGIVAGMFPYPDELKIQWSSNIYKKEPELNEVLSNYSIMSGWMLTDDYLIDPIGRDVQIVTGILGRHGDIWIGLSDGTLFQGKTISEVLYPISIGSYGNNVYGMTLVKEFLWFGSSDYTSGEGISWLNLQSGESFTFDFDAEVNMDPTPIYSIYDSDQFLWAGGNNVTLVYDKVDNYWRTLGSERGIPNGMIWDIIGDSNYVWMASSSGISRLNKFSWRKDALGFEYLFDGIPVYDLDEFDEIIWIASQSGLYVYNQLQPQLRNAMELGIKEFSGNIMDVRAIKEFEGSIYISCNLGIIKFDKSELVWEILFPSEFYHNKKIYSIDVNKRHLFLGTEEGLVRISIKTGFIREYFFPFIGQVNALELDNNIIWMGTSKGLLKFKWTREN